MQCKIFLLLRLTTHTRTDRLTNGKLLVAKLESSQVWNFSLLAMEYNYLVIGEKLTYFL